MVFQVNIIFVKKRERAEICLKPYSHFHVTYMAYNFSAWQNPQDESDSQCHTNHAQNSQICFLLSHFLLITMNYIYKEQVCLPQSLVLSRSSEVNSASSNMVVTSISLLNFCLCSIISQAHSCFPDHSCHIFGKV